MAKEAWARKFYNSAAWKRVRLAVLHRDLFVCQRCGAPDSYTVHHKIHLTADNVNNPYISLDMDNLITLCRECHDEVHGRNNRNKSAGGDYKFDESGHIVAVTGERSVPDSARKERIPPYEGLGAPTPS